MSKRIKNYLTEEYRRRLDGVEEAVLVNVVGLTADQAVDLRRQLRQQQVQLLVVKNGLARRATEGGPLAPALQDAEGSLALAWGAEDFVSLAKVITNLQKGDTYPAFETRGGVMDGEKLTSERVQEISKWPSRTEQLSILSGQILAPGSDLSAAILGPGSALASQINQKAEEEPDAS